MESSTLAQAQQVLSDLKRELENVRRNRRESLEIAERTHVQELEIMLGIDKTKEFIGMLEREKHAEKGSGM